MNYHIRECRIEDAPAIYSLNRDEMRYEYPPEKTEKKLERLLRSDKDKILVAVDNDSVVGYIHACDYDVIYGPHMKNIMGIAVSGRHKRQGIGRTLLAEIEKWAEQTGAGGVRLCSGLTRTGAHEFYRHCGYYCSKEQLNFKKTF